ncbi:hypothetical protein FB567DRAFT_9626 [Paraphoma chrysanthemicola]|uniref:Zn(2)-C6 fungal-type domain-containing protein n=1 Tax=Paraphoma chrysanthemicola TaxID=798071 RepID=A0A8K0W3J2_9PLEO|nr:hypothetical protein FB567DRAFT_9626 [Paraphoma chrysanthemicola]
MPSEVGPYDGRRARRKRCDACVQRKIKCHGGIPCENCKRTHRVCKTPVKPQMTERIFVSLKGKSLSSAVKSSPRPPFLSATRRAEVSLPQPVSPKGLDWYLPFFFASFLPMNIFTSDRVSMELDLIDLAKSSPALRGAMYAIAALHGKQTCSLDLANVDVQLNIAESLEAYNHSVCCIRKGIDSNELLDDPSALWTTFLLGLFELMHDSSGENWLSHFLHGTCTILRLQDPESLAFPDIKYVRKRTFFLATRTFEIARSLIYSSPSFLSEPRWTVALSKLWDEENAALWHPKEALFDILPHISDLSIRTVKFCETVDDVPIDSKNLLIRSFADEGLVLCELLQQWWKDATVWELATEQLRSGTNKSRSSDMELKVGHLYYHAISIYLSGTYDYHALWTNPGAPSAPILPRTTIEWHVAEILRLSQVLLNHGTAGVLLFFPLRVAGARAAGIGPRCEILSLLRTVERRGFVVAAAFTTDLSQLWAD